jgi:hypothetical protein
MGLQQKRTGSELEQLNCNWENDLGLNRERQLREVLGVRSVQTGQATPLTQEKGWRRGVINHN